jgi:N-acetylglucosamine-6-phosphate deacetylase
MATTFLSADQIFDGEHWLANNSCLVITDGTIEDIVTKEHIDANNIQHYPGILCPG